MEGDYLQYLQLVKWRMQQIRSQLRKRIRDEDYPEHDDNLVRELDTLRIIAKLNKLDIGEL